MNWYTVGVICCGILAAVVVVLVVIRWRQP
jgi:hypothetical protein